MNQQRMSRGRAAAAAAPEVFEFTKGIAASADDGRWYTDGTFAGTAGQLVIGKVSTGVFSHSFFRFTNVTIPQGATIQSASIAWYPTNTAANVIDGHLYGEAADNPTAVTSAADGNGRAHTTASTALDYTGWTTGVLETYDITGIIQEIVNRPGWASGNALQIFYIDDQVGSTNDEWPASYENATYTEPTITVSYTV